MSDSIFGKINKFINVSLDNLVYKATESYYDSFTKESVDFKEEDHETGEGWLDKEGYITFDFLREVSRNSLFTAIMLRRINELAAFAYPQVNRYGVGFKIRMRDEKAQATKENDDIIKELERFIFNTGLDQGRSELTKDPKNFEEFLRLAFRDRYIYNQVGIERVPLKVSKNGEFRLHSFYHVAASSLRYACDDKSKRQGMLNSVDSSEIKNEKQVAEIKKQISSDDVYAVQLYHNRIIRVFDQMRLILKQGNLDAELDNNGYSKGELELAVTLIGAHTFAETHNRLYFNQGFSNKGVFVIKKAMHRRDLEKFKQHFRQQMQGTSNSFRVPIIAGTEVQWVSFQADTKDMEWKEWIYYIIRLVCAYVQISPQEINFDIAKDATSTLGDGGQRFDSTRKMFKETGVRPMLKWMEGIINTQIIKYYNPDYYKKYVFEFVGLNAEQEQEETERLIKEVQWYRTVNEVRAEKDLDEIDYGDIILNPTYIQYLTNKEMEEQQNQQSGGGEGGMPGEDESEQDVSVENEADSETEPGDTEEVTDTSVESQINNILSEDKNKAEKALRKMLKTEYRPLKVEWFTKSKK